MNRLRKMLCLGLSALMVAGSTTACGKTFTDKNELDIDQVQVSEESINLDNGKRSETLANSFVSGNYKVDFVTPEMIDGNKNFGFSLCGSELYYAGFNEADFASNVYLTDFETQETKALFQPVDEEGITIGFSGVTGGNNGEILVLGNNIEEENRFVFELFFFDSAGKLIRSSDVNTGEEAYINYPVVLEKDRIICLVSGGSINSFACNVKQYNDDFRTFDDIEGLSDDYATSIGAGAEGKTLLINNGDSLKRFDPASGDTTKVLDWQSVNIDGYKVVAMSEENGKLYALISDYSSNNTELAIISEADPADIKEEVTTIKLATLSANDGIRQAISNFNRSQSEYRVELVNYQSGDYIGTQDDADKLMIDLLGDNPCDLIDLAYFENNSPDIFDMITKGYIVDLTPFIENSTVIKLDDFEEKAVETCKSGDFIAAIPYFFEIWTCLADEDMVNKNGSISVHDLIEYDRTHPEKIFAEGIKYYNIIDALLNYNLGCFVDKEKGTCDFDNEDFREIAEYAAEYYSEFNENEYYNFYSFGTERDIVKYTYLEKLEYFNYDIARYVVGKSTPIGMPTIDGSYRTIIDIDGNGSALGITSVSDNKEGAFEFIEYYLTMEPNDFWYGFPTNKEFLKNQIDKFSDESNPDNSRTYNITHTGSDVVETFQTHAMTEEEVNIFYELIEYSEPKYQGYDDVSMIVYQELEPYFAGSKSLDDAIIIIQNRVSIYLAENA